MTYTEMDNNQFVSDQSVMREILEVIEQSEEPSFIHAVTMANHLPYIEEKYEGGSTINVKSDNLSPESKQRIEVYAEGIKRSDETLKHFEEEIQLLDEPTLIVFWGDHLPALGPNLQAYIESGFGNEKTQQTAAKFYQTPLLFISNFDLDMPNELGTISPIYLAPMIVEALNYKPNLLYSYLLEMKKEVPAFKKGIYMKNNGQTVKTTEELSELAKGFLKEFHQIEYDILLGKGYSEKDFYN